MRQLIFSMFPTGKTDVSPNALMGFVDDTNGAVDVHVVYSRTQAYMLIRELDSAAEVEHLKLQARASRLPDLDETTAAVQLPAFSAMRVFNLFEKLQKRSTAPPALKSKYPCVLVLELTTPEQAESFRELAPNPDFMGVALDEQGDPEVVIGFSKWHAMNYLNSRAGWNLESQTLTRWRDNIRASALPRDQEGLPLAIKFQGFAAAAIYEMTALEYLERQQN